jgi:hypothetical protein
MQKETAWALHSVYRGVEIQSRVECLGYRYVTKYRTWYRKNGKIGYITYSLLDNVHKHINKIKEKPEEVKREVAG